MVMGYNGFFTGQPDQPWRTDKNYEIELEKNVPGGHWISCSPFVNESLGKALRDIYTPAGLLIFVPRMIKAYAHKTEFWVAATSSGGAWMISPTCAPYDAAKAAVNSLIYAYNQALEPYGGGATVLCPANINSNIGNAEKFRPANLKNTGYHVSEGTMATLRSIHATGIDPVELGEILKEGIENERIIVLPDHHPENWPQQLRSYSIQEEALCLTAAERKAAAEKQAEERRKMFEEMMKNAPKD